MKCERRSIVTAICLGLVFAALGAGQSLPAGMKNLVAAKAAQLKPLGTDARVVEAVKAVNAAAASSMTNERWKTLSQLDPLVRAFSKNAVALYVKTKLDPAVGEWFICSADGGKVAFLAKPSNWSHKGKEKHTVPMSGQTYYGSPELDESTGQQQVQVGFPVLDNRKPIGSMVVGLTIAKLK